MTDEKKDYCLKCINHPGYVFIKDPRKDELEKMRCPTGCNWGERDGGANATVREAAPKLYVV